MTATVTLRLCAPVWERTTLPKPVDSVVSTTRISVERRADRGATVVTLEGEFDLAIAPLLRQTLVWLPSRALPDVVADLHGVVFLDCSAVGAFVMVHKRAAKVSGRLHIAGATPQSRRLLDLTRLDSVFCLHDTVDAAVATHRSSS